MIFQEISPVCVCGCVGGGGGGGRGEVEPHGSFKIL